MGFLLTQPPVGGFLRSRPSSLPLSRSAASLSASGGARIGFESHLIRAKEKAEDGIRTHNLSLTKRLLYR